VLKKSIAMPANYHDPVDPFTYFLKHTKQVAECSKVLLYVAECCNIKKLTSIFCTSFLEVQNIHKNAIYSYNKPKI